MRRDSSTCSTSRSASPSSWWRGDREGAIGKLPGASLRTAVNLSDPFFGRPRWVRGFVLFSLGALAFGVYWRFTGLREVFCLTPDELAEVMPGLRLHALEILNLGDAVRYNFLKSMFYSQHGLGDVSFYYLASGLLGLLGLPISERWLFVAGGVTNLGLALAGWFLCARLFESRAMGWALATLIMVSPYYVFVSKTGWARLTWTPLLLLLLFYAQWKAMRGRGAAWAVAFSILGGFIALTDGFIVAPVVPVLGLLLKEGALADRVRALVRDRVFLAGFGMFVLGLVVDLVIGFGAWLKGTNLTMIGYVLLRGGQGSLFPTWEIVEALGRGIDWYLPFRGMWVLVALSFALAAVEGFRGRLIGFVAAWWLVAALALLRYAQGLKAAGIVPPVPSRLNAFNLALPSLLLLAWLIAAFAGGRLPGVRRFTPGVRAAAALAILIVIAVPLAKEADAVAFAIEPDTTQQTRQSACRVVKAAGYYVRTNGNASTNVFHLSGDVFLGHFAEFYYGLPYGRSSRPEDPNRILDFGLEQFRKRYSPEAFYRPYGVERFDYYVNFLDDPDPFKATVLERLRAAGARPVVTINDRGRPIGEILSFSTRTAVELEYDQAARAWDRTYARPRTLVQQPLTGTAYHFGYNWRGPE